MVAEILDGESGFAKDAGRAAGGKQFDAGVRQCLGEGDEVGFVGNGEKGALNC